DRENTALGHRVARIDRKVEEGQLELVTIAQREPQIGRQIELDADRRSNGALQHVEHALCNSSHIDRLYPQLFAAGEYEQPLREGRSTQCPLDSAVNQAQGAAVFGRSLAQELHVAEDGRQQVVEVVRDAARELAERFELLRLQQLVVRNLQL